MTLSPTTSTPPPPADSPAVLTAVLERVTYSNEETGYIVARVTTGRDGDLLTVVGPLAGAQPGEHLRMEGAEGYQRSDGLPPRRRRVHLAGRPHLQDLWGRGRQDRYRGALPPRPGYLGNRLQDRGQDRPEPRYRLRQRGAGQGRPAAHPLGGERGRPLSPAPDRADRQGV